jgi:hypothetical protein
MREWEYKNQAFVTSALDIADWYTPGSGPLYKRYPITKTSREVVVNRKIHITFGNRTIVSFPLSYSEGLLNYLYSLYAITAGQNRIQTQV